MKLLPHPTRVNGVFRATAQGDVVANALEALSQAAVQAMLLEPS